MRVPIETFAERPWLIHELTPDFKVEDVWDLPTPGGPADLPRLVQAALKGLQGAPGPIRAVWNARWLLGRILRLDRQTDGLQARVASLRDRLPAEVRATGDDPHLSNDVFTAMYLLPDEYAAELANRTVHAVMHLGWIADANGTYSGQMAVLVKPNGTLGVAYMVLIKPFRYLGVYPALISLIGKRWRETR